MVIAATRTRRAFHVRGCVDDRADCSIRIQAGLERDAQDFQPRHQQAHGLDPGNSEHEEEDRQRQRLERAVAGEGDDQSQATPGKPGRRRDDQHFERLRRRHAPEQDAEEIDRRGREQQGEDLEEAGDELAQDDFQVAQVGHEQQDEGPAVLLQCHAGGRGQRGEEEHERELEEREEQEQQVAEPSDQADFRHFRQPMRFCQAVHMRMKRSPAESARVA